MVTGMSSIRRGSTRADLIRSSPAQMMTRFIEGQVFRYPVDQDKGETVRLMMGVPIPFFCTHSWISTTAYRT